MATNIPPHNLREVIDAVVKIIDDQIEDKGVTTMEDILNIIKGPDFPTGATILGTKGIEEAYRTGAARSGSCSDRYRDSSKWKKPDYCYGTSLHGK